MIIEDRDPPASGLSRSQWTLVAVCLAFAVLGVGLRLLTKHHLDQTGLLFIGIPTLLAVVLAVTRPAKSVTGMIVKGMSICLLLSGPLLGEGFVCVLMAAPLFLLVGCVVGLIADFFRRRDERRLTMLAVAPLLLLSLEGTHPSFTLSRSAEVTVTRVVVATGAEVEAALAARPSFARPLPPFLRLRFPRPIEASGSGLAPGDPRIVRFAVGEEPMGSLALYVAERGPRSVRFDVLADSTPVSRWLTLRRSDVRWRALDSGRTEVTWTIHYQRDLDPAWYFGPLERFGVQQAAGYLIDATATPGDR